LTNTNDTKTAISSLQTGVDAQGHQKAHEIAEAFENFLREFHKYDQPYDDEMDAELYEQYARVLREQTPVFKYFPFKKGRPNFGPSSAGDSPLELYHKAKRSKKDSRNLTENQRDWIGLGSEVGNYVQREIMLAERHFEKLTGKKPPFVFERTERGEPAFEHFKKRLHVVEHDGEEFAIFGLPDGILKYTAPDGEIFRVGLEVKSAQKNWSAFKSQEEPKESHVVQTTAYSEMYGGEAEGPLDYFIVLYYLTYGREWQEDFSRKKAFGAYVTDADRTELKDRLADATRNAREGTPPKLDLFGWRFNDYKGAIIDEMTPEQFQATFDEAMRMVKSNQPKWKRTIYDRTMQEIRELYEAKNGGEA